MMRYIDIEMCISELFPLIHKELTGQESAADYAYESRGMAELEKAMTFVKDDGYYPTLEEKASYLLCSIAGSQYFSNGNKRLSVTILSKFIAINDIPVKTLKVDEFEDLLKESLPEYTWQNSSYITDPHALFIYNLAIVIGDRTQWGGLNFSDVKESVATMFKYIYQ